VARAFVVLEERLRALLGVRKGTGWQLVDKLFSTKDSQFTDRLLLPDNEIRGLRDIFAGSFAAFRNRAAHTVAGYSLDEARGIVQMVSLLLLIVDQIRDAPDLQTLPEVVNPLGTAAKQRLQQFLDRAREVGVKKESGRARTPYRATLNYHPASWENAKPHRVAVFYIGAVRGNPTIAFNSAYLSNVPGLDIEELESDLLEAGCVRYPSVQRPIRLFLVERNDQATFDRLFEILRDLVQEHRAY
jgi:hypothetical protein